LINEDAERAREMVTRLSNTLRHALEQNDREQVRLGEELAVVDDYLAIEAVHYEQRLRVNRRIEPAALDARLPPMALQLLVENAIRHGIAVTPGGGELELCARCAGGMLQLEVVNPGRLGSGSDGHGVGLAYLRAHLGRDGRFELVERDGRVVARLEIAQ
jgi:LytS/YehU family sensor histidine kinase